LYVILMYSQKWRTLEEVDRNLWTHWMAMVVPDIVSTDTGMLIVGGGKNTPIPDIDGSEVAAAAQFAVSTQSVVSIIGQIPNQPLFFYDEPFAHSEDELVAYTYDKALDTLDGTWPAYLPMTKASVRAMDTIQTLSLIFSPQPVNQFVVAGFSKRGSTREDYLRVRETEHGLELFANQSSGVLTSTCWADGLVRQKVAEDIVAGGLVDYLPFGVFN